MYWCSLTSVGLQTEIAIPSAVLEPLNGTASPRQTYEFKGHASYPTGISEGCTRFHRDDSTL